MSQDSLKTQLDKINLLFNVFLKEGMDKISPLEKDLLKEQVDNLLKQIEALPAVSKSIIPSVIPNISKEIESEVKKVTEKDDSILEKEKVAENIPEPQEVKKVSKIEFIADEVEKVKFVEEEAPQISGIREFSLNKPVRSMKELIDLNKSFILKAELFENSHEKYILFIEELNKIQNDEDSVRFVEKSANENNWNKEDKAYELLQRAVEKRFLPYLQQ